MKTKARKLSARKRRLLERYGCEVTRSGIQFTTIQVRGVRDRFSPVVEPKSTYCGRHRLWLCRNAMWHCEKFVLLEDALEALLHATLTRALS
jgi:hypothetical protein